MPTLVSTPPRFRRRSKTMTSASSGSRPSALRNGKENQSRGRPEAKESKPMKRKDEKSNQDGGEKKRRKDVQNEKAPKKEKEDKTEARNEKKAAKEEKQKVKEKEASGKEKVSEKEKKKEKDSGKRERSKKKDKDEKVKERKVKETEKPAKKDKKEKEEKVKEKTKDGKSMEKSRETEEDKAKEKKKKKKEKPVVFQPAVAEKIGHIFETPERKTRGASPSQSLSSMSNKEKTLLNLQKLTAVLNSSDRDDLESCPATDLEEMMNGDHEDTSEEEDDDEEMEDEEDQEDEEEEEEEEEDEDGEDQESNSSEEGETDTETEEESEEESKEEKKEETKGEEGKKGEAGAKDGEGTNRPEEHALVPVTQATTENALALRNSMSHKKEWDSFNRSAKGKMPASLSDYYQSNKTDLFGLWLDAKKDWAKVQVEVTRIQEQKNTAQRGWTAVQGKVLKKRYETKEKWEKVKESRKSAGLYYPDDDFPEDDDEA